MVRLAQNVFRKVFDARQRWLRKLSSWSSMLQGATSYLSLIRVSSSAGYAYICICFISAVHAWRAPIHRGPHFTAYSRKGHKITSLRSAKDAIEPDAIIDSTTNAVRINRLFTNIRDSRNVFDAGNALSFRATLVTQAITNSATIQEVYVVARTPVANRSTSHSV